MLRDDFSERINRVIRGFAVLWTYFLRKCPNPPVSGHHHFPSTLVVVTCSLDATSVIHCSSLPQWPAAAQLNVALYQIPRNAPHNNRNLQTENNTDHTLSGKNTICTVIPWNPNLIRSRTPFEFPIVRVPRQFFPFKIIETGLLRSWVPRTRIFKIILTVNTLDFKVKY